MQKLRQVNSVLKGVGETDHVSLLHDSIHGHSHLHASIHGQSLLHASIHGQLITDHALKHGGETDAK